MLLIFWMIQSFWCCFCDAFLWFCDDLMWSRILKLWWENLDVDWIVTVLDVKMLMSKFWCEISMLFGVWQVSDVILDVKTLLVWKNSFLMWKVDSNLSDVVTWTLKCSWWCKCLQWFESLNLNPQNFFFDAQMLAVNLFWCCDVMQMLLMMWLFRFCDSSWFDVRICSFGWCSVLMWISCVFFSWTRSQRISDVMMWFFWCVKLPEDFSSENVSNRFWCDEGCFFSEVMQFPWTTDVMKSPDRLQTWFRFSEDVWNFSDDAMKCPEIFLMLWCSIVFFDVNRSFVVLIAFWCCGWFTENFFWCPKGFSDVNLMLFCWSWFNKFLDSCVVRGCEFTGVVDLWDDLGLLRRSLATWRSETKSVTTIQPGIDLLVSILSWLNLHRCTSRWPAWLDLTWWMLQCTPKLLWCEFDYVMPEDGSRKCKNLLINIFLFLATSMWNVALKMLRLAR